MRYLKMNRARYVMGLTRIDFQGVTAVSQSLVGAENKGRKCQNNPATVSAPFYLN